ncbi:putative N-acetyltransferase, MSMEG_0567 N-terminal domain family [Prauserella aidingensis]|uniref:MSMEG_0567/sll0787 family protein n=1 Tax=Prauserella aidingensis TaxID=387890 RepID=UPI0020A56D36|nr:MSMEG_0567/sll0787 family protein [Prauserella aidingensis]MCP2252102.1 putative N-acetyltransferase, MSMEG_0567 N-terminal domain family [Prauserella aidingensis]
MYPDVLAGLGDPVSVARQPRFRIEPAADDAALAEYRALRRAVFVDEQRIFDNDDMDGHDGDPRTVVLLARDQGGTVLGGVRLHPATDGVDLGWWYGGRLVVEPAHRRERTRVGAALVRAAQAYAENAGVVRFEARVQPANERMFRHLGWQRVRETNVSGRPHVLMRYPIGRVAALVRSTKTALGSLLEGMPGVPGFVGDDGVPVPGGDTVAACDAILPSMVERDPEWAGWCSVLVNVNDLTAMGASPVGLLDALGARDASFASRVLSGLRAASRAWDVPVLGGHTQLGVPASLAVTALGRTPDPVPGGGGVPGQRVRLTADLGGSWRPGYTGAQWDSTSTRRTGELRAMQSSVAAARPRAAKDVSMAGIAGTLGMLAEASGCGAVLDVADVPRPANVTVGDWLTCFPGFAMITVGDREAAAGPAVSVECGELTATGGVRLRWPDGEEIPVLDTVVTGLGTAA